MLGLISWFARNRVAANLLMVIVMVAGAFTIPGLKQEVTPEIDSAMISVQVPYLGAAPEEVEEGICTRIEEAVQGIEGVDRLRSTAVEGMGTVLVELTTDADAGAVLDDVKAAVDRIDSFPAEAEEPITAKVDMSPQVLTVAVWGNAAMETLRGVAERLRDELTADPAISLVKLQNVPDFEIAIEVDEAALRRWSMTFDELAGAVRRASLDLPGGSVDTAAGTVLLRSKGQAYRAADFEDLVVRALPDGGRLRVGDVARVRDGFADTDQAGRFNGQPAVLLDVHRIGQQDALEIAGVVKPLLAEFQATLPEGLNLTVTADDSAILRGRLDLMIRNGRAGLVLVLVSLAMFLRMRLALWVTLGIPISFLGAFWLMPVFGVSINLISLFAFILVLGIVVDDAIVVGENVHAHRQRGGSGLRAAVRGTQEVAVPVFFAVSTTIAAFAPMLFLSGRMGQFARVIPLIVIATLVFSLIESLLILPAHLVHLPRERPGQRRRLWAIVQGAVSAGLLRFVDGVYRPSLALALRWRYLAVAASTTLLFFAAALVFAGHLKWTFFPEIEADNVVADLTLPQGSPVEITDRALRQLEASAEQLRRELAEEAGEPVVRNVITSIGAQPFRARQSLNGGGTTSGLNMVNLGEVNIELTSAEDREVAASSIAARWRELTGPVPGAVELVFTTSIIDSGSDIDVQLSGTDLAELRAAAADLEARLAEYSGIDDVSNSFREGAREMRLGITPEGEAAGLRLADLARQVRQAFYGEEVQRIQRGRDELKVMLRYPEARRASLAGLEDMRLRTSAGTELPFEFAARAEYGRGFSSIERVDRARAVHVTANVDPGVANASEILTELQAGFLPELARRHAGVRWSLEGEQREQSRFLGEMLKFFAIALLVIFALLAVPLRSYLQPLLIMTAIPFGVVGAFAGHLLLGMDLTMFSIIGLVALAGVVVNDSLVMIDFVNRYRREGHSLENSVREAGARRFRAILLTSLTTFAGLTPLLLEKSLQAQFLIPMAVSLGFGVLFATFLTLILLPCFYLILEDLRRLPKRLHGRMTA